MWSFSEYKQQRSAFRLENNEDPGGTCCAQLSGLVFQSAGRAFIYATTAHVSLCRPLLLYWARSRDDHVDCHAYSEHFRRYWGWRSGPIHLHEKVRLLCQLEEAYREPCYQKYAQVVSKFEGNRSMKTLLVRCLEKKPHIVATCLQGLWKTVLVSDWGAS